MPPRPAPRPVRLVPLRTVAIALALALTALGVGCAVHSEQLARAEQHYQSARYEAALVNLEDLEVHLGALSPSEHARYDLVRGRTHLRLDQRADARHWLALAREQVRVSPESLAPAAQRNLEATLVELDSDAGAAPAAAGDAGAGAGAEARTTR